MVRNLVFRFILELGITHHGKAIVTKVLRTQNSILIRGSLCSPFYLRATIGEPSGAKRIGIGSTKVRLLIGILISVRRAENGQRLSAPLATPLVAFFLNFGNTSCITETGAVRIHGIQGGIPTVVVVIVHLVVVCSRNLGQIQGTVDTPVCARNVAVPLVEMGIIAKVTGFLNMHTIVHIIVTPCSGRIKSQVRLHHSCSITHLVFPGSLLALFTVHVGSRIVVTTGFSTCFAAVPVHKHRTRTSLLQVRRKERVSKHRQAVYTNLLTLIGSLVSAASMQGILTKPFSIITGFGVILNIRTVPTSIFFREVFKIRMGHGKIANHDVQLGNFFRSKRKGGSRKNHSSYYPRVFFHITQSPPTV